MFQTKVTQKIKTHIFRSVTFFKNHAVYETIWKNMAQPDRPQTMCNACSIPKAKNTHLEYVKLLLMYSDMVTCMHLNVTLYVYCLSCYSSPQVRGTCQQALHACMTIVHILSLHTDVLQQLCSSYWFSFLRMGIKSW
jgi:hypothetical protein